MDKASRSIHRYDVCEGTRNGALSGVSEDDCRVLEIDPSEARIWTGSETGRITVWTAKTDYEPGTSVYEGQSFIGHPDAITGISG